MKKVLGVILTGVLLLAAGCSGNMESTSSQTAAQAESTTGKEEGGMESGGTAKKGEYTHIDQETAKEMMKNDDGHVIVDVRSKEEYESGHIPGAIVIPNEDIGSEKPEELPDLDQVILVYCRSGNRSRQASQKLADLGYTNVYDFGGINDWTGETVTGE